LKYHHIGIPTKIIQDKETYLEKYKLFFTDHTANLYGIQWMRYEADSPLPEIVKTIPHVAFEVEDLDMALQGKDVIIEPNSPSAGVKVAFIMEDGAPIEFIEYHDK
jgi:hypothetical protein